MPTYQPKREPGDTILYGGKFVTIMDLEVRNNAWKYKFAPKGKFKWKDAALVDRESEPADLSGYAAD
jgi:hypothetical protein